VIDSYGLLHFLFRIANIVVLFGFLASMFNRYILPYLRAGLEKRLITIVRLTRAGEDGDAQIAQIESSYSEREKLFEVLQGRVQQLIHYRRHQKKINSELRRRIEAKIEIRYNTICNAQALANTELAIMPNLLKDVQRTLQDRYADDELSGAYIAHSIDVLLQKKTLC